MDDSLKPTLPSEKPLSRAEKAQARQVAELQEYAMRAVLKPESLTMGEIQDVGWGYLMAAREARTRIRPR